MSQHTKGPWHIEPANRKDNWRIVGANGQVVSIFAAGMDMDNARRIVACVNACEGISTDQLEKEASNVREWLEQKRIDAIDMAARNLDLKQQRDQLLAALEKAVDRQAYKPGTGPAWWEEARAAIAAVKGGQP